MTLQQQLLDLLQQGKTITATWDGGDDEAFFYFAIDGVATDNDFTDALTEHLMIKGPISGNGEVSLEGNGSIFIANNEIVLKYYSKISGDIYDEYDEETEEFILLEEPRFEESIDEGVFTLFQL